VIAPSAAIKAITSVVKRDHALPGQNARARLTLLGWLVLAEATLLAATLFIPSVQPKPLGAALGLGLLMALGLAMWRTPRSLDGVRGIWILPASAHAGEEVTVGASLIATNGAPPLILEAWQPLVRRFEVMARLTGLDHLPTRPSWSTRFPRRGLNRLPPLTVNTVQPFGLISAAVEIGPASEFLVLPTLGRIRRELRTRLNRWLEAQAITPELGDDELARLRDYRAGDHPHRIHWKASARHRTLLVAERHAPGCRRLALVVDTSTGADARKLERLICVAATLVDHFTSEGWAVSLHGHFAPLGVDGQRLRLLETLALAGATNGDLLDSVPPNRTTVVLALNPLDISSLMPKPLVLSLDECEQLVWLPRRMR
jgi:uncharacterized protein (DUF58 family)